VESAHSMLKIRVQTPSRLGALLTIFLTIRRLGVAASRRKRPD
jgi:hypothetical protein